MSQPINGLLFVIASCEYAMQLGPSLGLMCSEPEFLSIDETVGMYAKHADTAVD